MFDPVLVHPPAAVPDRRRQPEQGVELVLPLPEKGFRSQDEHRPVAGQGHELRRHRQLQRLPEPDLIGQHEARAMRAAMRVEGELDEVLLVLPQPDLLAVDRRLHDDGRGVRVRCVPPAGDVPDQLAARQPIEVPDDEIREPDREGRRPEGVELLLHPRDGLRRIVLPDELVVEAKRRPGLVRTAEEGGLPAVSSRNDARLAVDQAEDVIGQYADLDLPGTQEVVEPPEARPGAVTEVFGAGVAPLAAHGSLGGLGDLDVGAGQPGVADDPDLAFDAFQRLARHFEDRGGEVAGDAVVAPRAGKPRGQEAGIERSAARGMSRQHGSGQGQEAGAGSGAGRVREGRVRPQERLRSLSRPWPRKRPGEKVFHERGSFHSRTMNRSPSSTRSGSVPLCSRIPRMIVRGTPIPMCSM